MTRDCDISSVHCSNIHLDSLAFLVSQITLPKQNHFPNTVPTDMSTAHIEEKKQEMPLKVKKSDEEQEAAFADKVFRSMLGAQVLQATYIGHKLKWYETLAKAGSSGMTPKELATATDTSARYAREWLEL